MFTLPRIVRTIAPTDPSHIEPLIAGKNLGGLERFLNQSMNNHPSPAAVQIAGVVH
mgnify:CR=1 FL=1